MKRTYAIVVGIVFWIGQGLGMAQSTKSASKSVDDAFKLLSSGNYPAAIDRFQVLAAAGNTKAMLGLTEIYYNGFGVAEDKSEALKWLKKAADGGEMEAQFQIGRMYDIGLFGGSRISTDKVRAAKWYQSAAERGQPDAAYGLAMLYSSGEGVPQDEVETIKWVIKSADLGNVAGQAWVARLYTYGEGGFSKDYVKAYMWYTIADLSVKIDAEPGGPPPPPSSPSKMFASERRELATQMTQAEIAKAQRLARTWKPTKATAAKIR